MSKVEIRVFTIADYEEEEAWLREQHKNGLKLVRTHLPCFFIFEECEPEDVVYRLDYKKCQGSSDYMQMFQDFGWEYFNQCMGWLYFRKARTDMDTEQDCEIFSDNESKIQMLEHIIKTRMLPLMLIFFTCLIPQWIRAMDYQGELFFKTFFSVLMLIYVYLILHCGLKLKKLKKKYQG